MSVLFALGIAVFLCLGYIIGAANGSDVLLMAMAAVLALILADMFWRTGLKP